MHVIVEGTEEESSRNAETDANVESVISPIPGENPLPGVNGTIIEERLASSFKLWTFVLLNFVWAMIVVGVVVGVIVKRQNRKVPAPLSGSGIQLIPMEFQGPCGLQGKEAFNVRLQCDCQDTISFVLEESFALYEQLYVLTNGKLADRTLRSSGVSQKRQPGFSFPPTRRRTLDRHNCQGTRRSLPRIRGEASQGRLRPDRRRPD